MSKGRPANPHLESLDRTEDLAALDLDLVNRTFPYNGGGVPRQTYLIVRAIADATRAICYSLERK